MGCKRSPRDPLGHNGWTQVGTHRWCLQGWLELQVLFLPPVLAGNSSRHHGSQRDEHSSYKTFNKEFAYANVGEAGWFDSTILFSLSSPGDR